MDRLACVDLPAFALQIALRKRPEWRGAPVAVVDRCVPTGTLLWVDARARRSGVAAGMRYSAGLALCAALRAREVPPVELEAAVADLLALLRRFSPDVEPADGEPGVFWLSLCGLERLHPDLELWAAEVHETLRDQGWRCAVVVGWRRFACYALAKAQRGACTVTRDEDSEQRAAQAVPLDLIVRDAQARSDFERLAVRTVGEFARLPSYDVLIRYGREVQHVHRLASGACDPPLEPRADEQPLCAAIDFDSAESDRGRLLACAEELAQPLFAALDARGQAAAELVLTLDLERAPRVAFEVRAARPTLEWKRWARLCELRLERTELAGGALRMELLARGARAAPEQTRLFSEHPGRDPRAASEVFASLRAALGDDVVTRARLLQRHLPESSFAWERLESVPVARPRAVAERRLVRRIFAPARLLPPRPRREPDGWFVLGLEHGPAIGLAGPYRVSGGWWQREARRDYYFAELQRGLLVWLYHDDVRRRWMCQGAVD